MQNETYQQEVSEHSAQESMSDRPKLTYFPWSYAGKVQNIYPEYDFIPFHKALFQRQEIRALVGFKGRDSFLAKLFGFPYWALNEGLYRLSGHKPCSFTLEQFGDYTDAHKPSEWEEWMLAIPVLLNTFSYNEPVLSHETRVLDDSIKKIEGAEFSSFMRRILRRLPSAFPALSPHNAEDARELLASLLKYRLSSDRFAPDVTPFQLYTPGGRKRVLILDEARLSKKKLKTRVASENSFFQMFEAARKENSGAAFFLLEPKSVRTKKRKGYLRKLAEAHGVKVLDKDVSSISIIEQADIVYTVSSHLGVDAIFLGKKIRCFGMPFYAGWGLTKDNIRIERRNVNRTKEEFFAALALYFTRYRHPITGESGSFQDLLRFIILQRPLPIENNRYIACMHFDDKLKAFCQRFFSHSRLEFLSQDKAIRMARENQGMIFTALEPDDEMRNACGSIPLVFVNVGVLDSLLEQDKYVSLSLEGASYPHLERMLQTVKPQESDLLRARLFRQYLREISAFRTHYTFNHISQEKDVILLIGNRLLPPAKFDAQNQSVGDVASKAQETTIVDDSVNTVKNMVGRTNLNDKGQPINSFSSPLSNDAMLIQHVRKARENAYIIYCPQVEGMNVPAQVLALVDDIKPYARPSDFVPLEILGIAPKVCESIMEDCQDEIEIGNAKEENSTQAQVENVNKPFTKAAHFDESPAFVIDDGVECLPHFKETDFTKWSRKHVAAKRFLEKAHNMTTVNGQFCPLFYPLKSISGHTIEVHAYDSYLGLDALAVDIPVFTYGWPFYAGWGLTTDTETFPLRTRRPMNVETLFAAAFILQPRYFDTLNDIFCEPENSPYLLMRDKKQ